jgi:hypothetical protein
MDLDRLAMDFARFKPMLEEMLPEWKAHKTREKELAAEDDVERKLDAEKPALPTE